MFIPGICSITFRKLPAEEVVRLVSRSAVKAVEWGGDIHVPHGDLSAAREVRKMSEDAGLEVASYGSYYRLGEETSLPFSSVCETARELGAPVIRVWAGRKGSAEADDRLWKTIAEDGRRVAALAEAAGISVALEYHGNTLTDTRESAARLLSDISHPRMGTYWQPFSHLSVDDNLLNLRSALAHLVNIHAFSWETREGRTVRMPLSAGADAWKRYLASAAQTGKDHRVLLEFVPDDAPEAFLRDAQTLASLVRSVRER